MADIYQGTEALFMVNCTVTRTLFEFHIGNWVKFMHVCMNLVSTCSEGDDAIHVLSPLWWNANSQSCAQDTQKHKRWCEHYACHSLVSNSTQHTA